MPLRNFALFHALVVLALSLTCVTLSGCKWKRKKGIGPDASASSSASSASASASVAKVPPPPTVPPAPVDPLSPPDRALVVSTTSNVAAVDALVKKNVLSDPAKPGDADAEQRCSTIEDAREKLETLADADGEIAKLIAETRRLCSLEVPIIACNIALRQAANPSSQASHKLVCGFAQKDFVKARAAKPTDRRIFDLGSRLTSTCN